MMSGSSGTSRANSRTSKDKTAKTQHTQNSKTDGPPSKAQATAEQMRLAEMISDKSAADEELKHKIQELAELTGKDNDHIAIALHDCENDLNRAYLMLVEGENDQGEWKESGKKKKRQPSAAQKASDTSVNHHASDSKSDRTDNEHRDRPERDGERDRDASDFPRNDNNSRRGRRNDTRPPRLSRGRGRDRDRGNDMIWRDGDQDGEKNNRDEVSGGGRERGRGRGRGVNGPGRRGGRGGRGGGGGGGGAGDRERDRDRPFRSQRFDKGPQIDTWTNETAENAEKEQALWSDAMGAEDWNDDSWTGSLTETKVFTASTIQGGPMGSEPQQPPLVVMPDTNSLPQANSLPQRLDLGVLLQKTANDVNAVSAVSAESQFITQYNKEATESIKNSIGIGSSSRQNLAASAQNVTVSQLASMPPLSTTLSAPLAAALQQSSRLPPSQSVCPPSAVGLQPRPKPQKSKLPPPSKIPASAVEMPGHMVTSLDVQFGNLEFGTDSFSFGSTDSPVTSNYAASTTPSVRNHLDQVSPESGLASAMRSAGTTPTKSGMTALDQTSPRGNVFQNSSYSTTPTNNEISSPEPIPFPSSQSERKTSPLVNSQRPGQTAGSLQQGSLATNSADTSGIYGQSASYQSSNYKPSGINSSSQSYTHSSSTLSQSGQYQSPLPSQTSQNQFQTGQNQYQTSQNQYTSYQSAPSFQSQTGFSSSQPNQGSLYQSATSTGSYPSQTGSTYPSRDDQSGSSFQTNASQPSGSSYQNRDSQPTASYQRESQTGASYQRDSQAAGSYQRESQQTGSSYQRESQTGSSSYQREAPQASPYQRESHSSVPYPRDQSGGSSYQREAQTTGSSYPALDSQSSSGSYSRETQPGVSSYQRDTQSSSSYQSSQAGSVSSYQRDSQSASSYPRDTQSASSYTRDAQSSGSYPRDTQSASSYPRDTQSAGSFQRDGQTGSSYQRDSQPSNSYQRDSVSQSASSYPRDSQSSSSYPRDSQTSSSYPRDSQTSSSYPRDSQTTSAYHRDGQSAGSLSYQRDSSQAGQGQSAYGSQTYNSTNHQSPLQTSPLSTGKLGDTLSKMAVKEHSVDSTHQTTQHSYDHSSTTTVSLTSTTSTASSSLASGTTGGVSSAVTVTTPSNINMIKTNPASTSSTSKAPPNLPPGVPLLNAQYIMNMGQAGGIPPYFSLQQPLYPGYEELQLLQQRGVPLGSYYDMSSFGAPTTMAGRDQTPLGSIPYTVGEGKLTRVDAQSPVPTTQPQQSQSAHQQPFLNPALHPGYGYYPYPSMLQAGFQYPHTMFQMPPVTNTAAHAGSTANSQYQKAYGSHSYGAGKGRTGYDDLSQPQDFSKGYGGVAQSQTKVTGSVSSVSSGSGSATDLAGYGKSHAQVNAFDKQAFHTGTPTSFNLPMSSGNQAGHMGAPTTPYHQYVPMMPHQAHSMLHHPLQQDSTTSGRGTQPSSSQLKTGASKPYGNYWTGN